MADTKFIETVNETNDDAIDDQFDEDNVAPYGMANWEYATPYGMANWESVDAGCFSFFALRKTTFVPCYFCCPQNNTTAYIMGLLTMAPTMDIHQCDGDAHMPWKCTNVMVMPTCPSWPRTPQLLQTCQSQNSMLHDSTFVTAGMVPPMIYPMLLALPQEWELIDLSDIAHTATGVSEFEFMAHEAQVND